MTISENVRIIDGRIREAASRVGRLPDDVRCLAVSKKQEVARIQEYLDLRHSVQSLPLLGENYVQEYEGKSAQLAGIREVHLIGPLQSNKVKKAVQLFDVIQSIHSFDRLREVNRAAESIGKTQRIFLQVNVSDDSAKSGFEAGDLLATLGDHLPNLSSVRIEGLMTITKLYDDSELARPDYRSLRELGRLLEDKLSIGPLSLSMGMSDDFEVAIEEGATLVRIGTALFGPRV